MIGCFNEKYKKYFCRKMNWSEKSLKDNGLHFGGKMDGLSIILPTFNNSRYLNLCLQSLLDCSELDNEILIHIDGSTDNTREVISNYQNNSSLNIKVTESKNKGLYSSINTAMCNATKEYFILLNDDIVVGPLWDINFIKGCKHDRVMCPWMVESGMGSYTQKMLFGSNDPEGFNLDMFYDYCYKNIEDKFIKNWTVGMWSARTMLFKEINGCDEAFNPFGYGGGEILYRIKILHPEYEFGAYKNSLVYHFSAACRRENNRNHLFNGQAWYDKYPEIEAQDMHNLLEGKRDYYPIEKMIFFKNRCLTHLGKGLY